MAADNENDTLYGLWIWLGLTALCTALKLDGAVTWPWRIVLAPLWATGCLVVVARTLVYLGKVLRARRQRGD
jgi:hypothetical protein